MRRALPVVFMLGVMVASTAALGQVSLTLFHNNDGESKLLGSGDFGGFDYFLGELDQARQAAETAGRDTLTISSGDNFLAGLAFQASQDRVGAGPAGNPDVKLNNYYDALALVAAGYDAITMGNHEFDFGPTVLADFISGYNIAGGLAPFLSSNLDVSADADLGPLATGGQIAASTVVVGTSGTDYGIIGVTTPLVTNISSPGSDVVPTGPDLADVAAAVNAEVATLQGMGVEHVILSGHLQALSEDQQLVGMLQGVDVIIAGGGDELLLNTPDDYSASFGVTTEGPYPVISTLTDLDGRNVPLVTTPGEYRYVGQLEVEFDASGNVTQVGGLTLPPPGGARTGDPILVDPTVSPQATGDYNGIDVQADIMVPLAGDVATLEATKIGETNVGLDGVRGNVRTKETNLGDLITDAFLYQGGLVSGLTNPMIAVTNGGGIRNDSLIPVGDLTAGDIIDILPFPNSVALITDFTVPDLVSALENSISSLPGASGRFLQIGGFNYIYNVDTGEIKEITLADGTLLYTDGLGDVYGGNLDLVTNSFTAGGGDSYDEFAAYPFTDLSVSYSDALRLFIEGPLGGLVDGTAYPLEGLGRITEIPEPATLGMLVLGGAMAIRRRRNG